MVSVLRLRQAEVPGKSKDCLEMSATGGCDLDTTGGGEATPEAHLPPKAFFSSYQLEHVPNLLYFAISHR